MQKGAPPLAPFCCCSFCPYNEDGFLTPRTLSSSLCRAAGGLGSLLPQEVTGKETNPMKNFLYLKFLLTISTWQTPPLPAPSRSWWPVCPWVRTGTTAPATPWKLLLILPKADPEKEFRTLHFLISTVVSLPYPQSMVSLSTVSVTCGQLWSEKIKREIPEIKNSKVLNCVPL